MSEPKSSSGKFSKPKKGRKIDSPKSKDDQGLHVCDDCIFSVPFFGDGNWNCNIQTGRPITMHCNHQEHMQKGIFYGTKACKDYKPRDL